MRAEAVRPRPSPRGCRYCCRLPASSSWYIVDCGQSGARLPNRLKAKNPKDEVADPQARFVKRGGVLTSVVQGAGPLTRRQAKTVVLIGPRGRRGDVCPRRLWNSNRHDQERGDYKYAYFFHDSPPSRIRVLLSRFYVGGVRPDHNEGAELSRYGAPLLHCPGPMPQGVSYVHHVHNLANLYIRNIMPIGVRPPAGANLALSGWGYAPPQSRRLRPVSMNSSPLK